MRILTWNLKWATPTSPRGRELARRIRAEDPDLVCLTETVEDFLAGSGFSIASEPRPMFSGAPRRRKAVLWSRNSWTDVDTDAGGRLSGGRFVRGVTDIGEGTVEIWGVCIPWWDSHVRNGRKDCQRWDDHLAYLGELKPLLLEEHRFPRIVLGDFNQRIPRARSPVRAYEALMDAFSPLSIATSGTMPRNGKQTIDHVAHSRELAAAAVYDLSQHHEGKPLSDHFGVAVDFTRTATI